MASLEMRRPGQSVEHLGAFAQLARLLERRLRGLPVGGGKRRPAARQKLAGAIGHNTDMIARR